jgi:four helix bundle protein
MPTFEDLRAFRRAIALMVAVYKTTESFPKHELYGLTFQLRRAACSVASNIAEGQGRLTLGERRQMLSHARGSLYEVQAQVIACACLELIDETTTKRLRNKAEATAREIDGLIDWIKRRESELKRATKPKTPNA